MSNLAGCAGKVSSFGTFKQADRSARRLRRLRGGNVAPYPCRDCHQYHLGSSQGGQHAEARQRRLKIQKLREREVWE